MKIVLKKASIVLITTIISLSLLVSCGSGDKSEPIALAIVIGNHANSYAFSETVYEKIEPLIDRALINSVYNGGSIDVDIIIADGEPRRMGILSSDGAPVFIEDKANNEQKGNKMIETTRNEVLDFLKSDATKAANPEVDLLAAIKEAERALRNKSVEEKCIIIIDTGVPTAGRINLNEWSLEKAEISEVVERLSSIEGVLPDLTGIKIAFWGLGDTAKPQVVPDTTYPRLEQLWHELFIACGVQNTDINFFVLPSGSTPNLYSEDETGFPYVTVVDFAPIEISILSESDDNDNGLILPDIGFQPDSPEIISGENAKKALKPYAEAIIQYFDNNHDSKLFLVGTTATTVPNGDGNIVLSHQRAEKLREVLSELGVQVDRLVVIGVGSKVPSHLRVNEFANGIFDSGLAQANRKATIYEVNNKDFQEILAFNNINLAEI